MKKSKKLLALSATAIVAVASGCGSSSSSSSSGESVGISGKLATTGGSSRVSLVNASRIEDLRFDFANATAAVDLTSLKLRCATSSDFGEGSCGSDGAFSVSVPNAKGKKIGCFIFQGDDIVGTLVFKNPNKKSL